MLSLLGAGALLALGACGSDDSSSSGSGGTSSTSSGGGGTSTSSGGGGQGGTSTGAGGGIDCGPAPTGQAPPLKLTQVASGLSSPLFITGAPGDTSRLYIVERGGRIKILSDGNVLPTPFLNIDSIVHDGSMAEEYGLLSLAFHPDYATNGRFFIFYVANDGRSVLAEYRRSTSNPDLADGTAVDTLLTLTEGGGRHFSGMLAFGNDGYLYVGSGDRDGGAVALDLDDQRGKILRLDVDNHPTAPPGNMPGGDPYVWDYGLRNPWRFSFDRCSQDIYIGDVGEAHEEINIESAGQGHKNYGWNLVDSGTECSANCTGVTLPVIADNHNTGNCSFIGGYVYRGSLIPGLNGRYIYGDFCSGRILSFVRDGDGIAMEEELFESATQYLSSFGEDSAGNLYVIGLAGVVYRIDAE